MSQPTPQTAAQLLQRVREQVLTMLCVSYLIFLGLGYMLQAFPAASAPYRNAGAGLSLLSLALIYAGAFRHHWVRLAAATVASLLCLGSISPLLQHHWSEQELLLWLSPLLLIFYVLLGSTLGGVFSLLILGGLGTMLLLYPLGSDGLSWLTGGLVLIGTSVIAYLLMQFIERNINLHEQASDELKAARLDALTGIYGRAAAEAELRRAINHALKSSTSLSVVVTDIDHFKRVNDQHGHGTGDDVLRSFAKRLRRNVGGSGGIVGRWGGEEFLIILPAVSRPDAIAMAERLRHEVSSSPIAGLEITASFGVASFRGQGDDLEQLFGRADERLYEAKNAGRNAVRG